MPKCILHVTQHFWPPLGGQEKIIQDICLVSSSNGYWSIILQPLKLRHFDLRIYFRKDFPSKTLVIPIPTLFLLIDLIHRMLKLVGIRNSFNSGFLELSVWLTFNWSLKLVYFISLFFPLDFLTFIHYHFHFESFTKRNSIIFSHGVEWQRPPLKKLDILRFQKLSQLPKYQQIVAIIANDRDYINELSYFFSDEWISDNVIYMPNSVDTNFFNHNGVPLASRLGFKKIVMIRNIREDRGIKEGISAFIEFSKIDDYSDWTLDIYGHYSENDPYFLECNLLKNMHCPDRIFFKGVVNNDSVPLIYKHVSISLVPSQSLEGTSLSALESMSCGIPCVSTPVGGLNDIPTFKSQSIDAVSISRALVEVCRNYEVIQNDQIQKTRSNFSRIQWQEDLISIIRKYHNGN
jgi:glycosyltransferase involved in cell wall biosynthesis